VPILVATEAEHVKCELQRDYDNVYRPLQENAAHLRECIRYVLAQIKGTAVNAKEWSRAPYHPTPTIIEAARALYGGHSVTEIARHDAGAENLAITSRRVEQIVDEARALNRKAICFVTGVPG